MILTMEWPLEFMDLQTEKVWERTDPSYPKMKGHNIPRVLIPET